MERSTKSVDVPIRADENGSITGYASTFTREPDWAGDVVAKGAFAEWLDAYRESGKTLPLLYNHEQDLDSFIGKVTSIGEDDHGLLFTAEFDATEKAQRARELATDGRLSKFSFAYVVRDQAEVTLADGRKANELRRLDVDEVSLVLMPCNEDTSVVDVKYGRRNSQTDEDELRAIGSLLSEAAEKVGSLIGDEPDEEPDATETDQSAEGGEDDASSKGREVEQARFDAYKRAILRGHSNLQKGGIMPTLTEQRAQLLKSIQDADSMESIKELEGKLEVIDAKIKHAEEGQSILKALAPETERIVSDSTKPATMGGMAAKAAGDLHLSKSSRGNFVLLKTDPATHTSPGAASTGALTQLAQTLDGSIVPQYRMPLVVRDLLGAESISGNALTYFVEAADSGILGGPAKTAEGAAKPMVEFPDPTSVTEALVKVASYYKETDELLEDYAWLASSIDNRALYLHRKWVNNVLLNGTSATHGIVGILNRSGIGAAAGTSSAPTVVDADHIFGAMMAIEGDAGMTADAIVINPADYQTLRLAKDSNDQYYGGGYFAGQYGTNGMDMYPSIWGLRTVVTPAIAAGTCLVGAFRQGASVISKAGSGLRVEMTNSDADDFTKNRVTVRVEERLALAVRYPKAFYKLVNYSS